MDELFKTMLEEKHDFYHYLDLYDKGADASAKATFRTIAEQEANHYKMLHDIIFKPDALIVWTPMEKVVKDETCAWYSEMIEELKKRK